MSARPATARLKFNPPLGRMPVLQYAMPSELMVDETYQRSLDSSASASLIRKLAQYWNWDLCQPLVVARRSDGGLYVIDGQHRLEAARTRGDITQLPCVIVEYASAADEAASFVHLNQQRRPLSYLDVFKAAVASEDPEACAIAEAMAEAGLKLASHTNYAGWQPAMVSNIGGIQQCWRERGPKVTLEALTVLAQSFPGAVLRYGGTLFPGIAAVVHRGQEYDRSTFVSILGGLTQAQWSNAIQRYAADNPETSRRDAMISVIMTAWREQQIPKQDAPAPIAVPVTADKVWCEQCDRSVSKSFAESCRSRFCSLRVAA